MKYIKLLIALLVLTSCGGGGGSNGGELSNNSCATINLPAKDLEAGDARIINGETCGALGNSPVVRLVMYNSTGGVLGFCSGSMLTAKDVLTAAHCVVKGTEAAEVIYGDAGDTKIVSVGRILKHPGYQPISAVGASFAAFNDLAIYTLRENINLPVLPLNTSRQLQSGDVIDIYGYGVDENGTLDFKELKSGEMLVDSVTPNHISSFYTGDGANTCQGDSGGPAIVLINNKPAIAGVTSTGTKNACEVGDNSLFINVQSKEALDFILSVVPGASKL
jgi:secreted trypsin-like serine protease